MAGITRIKLTIEYDGTAYAGWQIQPNANTVQAELEKALKSLTGEAARVHGAGRTDSGVHALGQTAHFDTQSAIPDVSFAPALNQLLPEDIRVTESAAAEPDFHARFSARGKTYSYRIYNAWVPSAVFRSTTYCVHPPLDVERMQKAARHFLGEHDFGAFCAAGTSVEDKVRRIDRAEVKAEMPLVTFTVTGSGFLYNMVRIMAGTLIDVGTGKISPDDIPAIIESRDRDRASATPPARGLILERVIY